MKASKPVQKLSPDEFRVSSYSTPAKFVRQSSYKTGRMLLPDDSLD